MKPSPLDRSIQRLFVAGHRGMVGQAVCRYLKSHSQVQVITASRDELDLCNSQMVDDFYQRNRPDAVVIAAAKVGGILANDTYPVEFLTENLKIATNCIESAYRHDVKRLLFLGSTCIYPRDAPQPIAESSLLTSPLETTNEAYALAKITGLKLCQYYRRQFGAMFHSAMPTNLYGPGDNYHPQHSHVLPALMRRFHEAAQASAPSVTIWGTGSPRREFLHVDDLAAAIVHLLSLADPPDWVNVGTGEDITIKALAQQIADVVGFQGEILTDPSKPDGTPRKLTDVSLIHNSGWHHQISLADGLRSTFDDFLNAEQSRSLREA